ncbi:MAG: hypothetical protein WB795_08185 [Candidatus Acidiferrales bacterium]
MRLGLPQAGKSQKRDYVRGGRIRNIFQQLHKLFERVGDTPEFLRLARDFCILDGILAVQEAFLFSEAAAPTYFPGYDSSHYITLVDGGIWANNPVAVAVVEAVSVLGWSKNEIDVLSIGCTEETKVLGPWTEIEYGARDAVGKSPRL